MLEGMVPGDGCRDHRGDVGGGGSGSGAPARNKPVACLLPVTQPGSSCVHVPGVGDLLHSPYRLLMLQVPCDLCTGGTRTCESTVQSRETTAVRMQQKPSKIYNCTGR